LKLLRSHDAQ